MMLNKFSRFIRSTFFACSAVTAASASAEVVDVLVLYTPEALTTRNGADINARISSYIAYANTAYENSQVDMQLRLVGSQLINVPYQRVTEENLSNLSRDSAVAALREQTGADLVTLLNLRQEMSGGYICGIGYVPAGRSDTGQFYSNAASAGFSLVGIDCGVNTFAHELGHNMGLGHSYKQNSQGGIWPWARGHGVNGLFSTIMAYPQSFATNNQLPVFSNPNISSCVDLACGVDKTRTDGADAAASLVALSAQIAAFRRTVVDETGLPGDDTPVNPPVEYCPTGTVANNKLVNGEFNSTSAWQAGFGSASLGVEAFAKGACMENRLVVSQRTAYYSSAMQVFNQPLQTGKVYQFKGEFAIRGGTRESIRVALRVRTSRGSYYSYLNPLSVTATEMTSFSQTFTVTSGQTVDALLVYGPAANVDIVMDTLSLVQVN
jgi:hypothetical protein